MGPHTAQNQGFFAFCTGTLRPCAPLHLRTCLLHILSAVGVFAIAWWLLEPLSHRAAQVVAPVAAAALLLRNLRHAQAENRRQSVVTELARALLDVNRECLKLLDCNGRMLRISEYGAELMQAESPERLAGANWLSFWPGEQDARAARHAFESALDGQRSSFTGNCATTTGEPKRWHSRLIPLGDGRGGVAAVLCASLDITREAAFEADSRTKSALLTEMEAHVPLCFYSYSADFSYFFHVSAGSAAVFGIDAATLRQRPQAWLDLVAPEDRPEVDAAMCRIKETSIGGRLQYRIRRAGGAVRWIQSTGYPVVDASGNVIRVVGVSEDITAERERLAELDRLAFSDPLTGLANRSELVRRIKERCAQSATFALMFIDLDRFKVLNDTLGHTAADHLLRSLSELIQAALPADAVLARLGGDEFAVLIASADDKQRLAAIARDILDALAQKDRSPRVGTFVTASIGISVFPENGEDHETLLTRADIAMYAAKKAGRNGFRFADKDAAERIVDFELERDLPVALASNQFVLHYQAIHDSQTLGIRQVEALIRWQHPTRGLVPPGVFIPILEDSGFIAEVGAWVLDDALRQLAYWQKRGADALGVSVNVSAHQLRDSGIVAVVDLALRRHALPAASLQLELTESALMENPELAQRNLSALKRLGVRIAIDDFGTGYSSLRYLTDFAPDSLKIDRSFVSRMESDRATRSIVGGIIKMSHSLGISVTAEGVENENQLRMLQRSNCDFVQGYFLGRPTEPEAVAGLKLDANEAPHNERTALPDEEASE